MTEERFRAEPVTAWVLSPVSLTADIPLWELRPWYVRGTSDRPEARGATEG